MSLAQYTDVFWFPDGTPAANLDIAVFLEGSSTFAVLWADSAGTIPLPNPLPTGGAGQVSFFTTVGRYWIHLDTETFPVDVGMSQEQADLTTGLASGGDMSINAGNPKAVDFAPLVGYVVSNNMTTSSNPLIVRVDSPARTVVLDAPAQTRTLTFWLMDSSGVITQQATRPTNVQKRTHLSLGGSVYDTVSGTLMEVQSVPVILPQQGNQLADLMDALGPFSLTSNPSRISSNGVNLSFNKSAGTLFARAFNHYVGSTLTNDPHITPSPAQTPAQFRRVTRTPAATPPVVTTIDPANFDSGGVLTPVGGGINSSTIQRVYLFPTGLATDQIIVQYGQTVYSSLANAIAAVGAGMFVPNPVTVDGTLIGWIVVIRTATNLSDPTQATFIQAGKFATP